MVTLELKKQSQQKACQVDRILHEEISNSAPFSTIAATAATGLPSIRIFACKKNALYITTFGIRSKIAKKKKKCLKNCQKNLPLEKNSLAEFCRPKINKKYFEKHLIENHDFFFHFLFFTFFSVEIFHITQQNRKVCWGCSSKINETNKIRAKNPEKRCV